MSLGTGAYRRLKHVVTRRVAGSGGLADRFEWAIDVVSRRFRYKYRLYSWFAPYVRRYFETLGILGLVLALFSPQTATAFLESGVEVPIWVVEFGRSNLWLVFLLFAVTYLHHVREKHRSRSAEDPPRPHGFVERVGIDRVYRVTGWILAGLAMLFIASQTVAVLVVFLATGGLFSWYVLPHKLICDSMRRDEPRFVWGWEFVSQFSFVVAIYYLVGRIPETAVDQAIGNGDLFALVALLSPLLVFAVIGAIDRRIVTVPESLVTVTDADSKTP